MRRSRTLVVVVVVDHRSVCWCYALVWMARPRWDVVVKLDRVGVLYGVPVFPSFVEASPATLQPDPDELGALA